MKRLASMFLALCLLLGMAPPRVFAADTPPELVEALAEAVPDDAADTEAVTLPPPETENATETDAATLPDTDSGQASLTDASGTCGDNLTWVLDDAGTLTISGTGAMTDFEQSAAPWFNDYRKQITAVVIENGVTHIGDYAFSESENLDVISIPESVSSMGEMPFTMCMHLSAINVANGNAQYSSDNGILFNKQKTELIWYPAHKGYLPGGTVSDEAKSYVIPNSVTKIGENAFEYCGLENVTIPNGVTEIGERAFFNCLHITAVDIPESVASIGDAAFAACNYLSAVNVASGNAQYVSDNGILFSKDKSKLLCYPAKKAGTSYEIPNSVTFVGQDAFSGHNLPLTDMTIHSSVTKIDQNAFSGCQNLANVQYDGTLAQWNAIEISNNGNDPLLNATIHYNGSGADTYTVTFNPNGGTLSTATTVTVQANATVSEPTQKPTRDGYEFMGWFTDLQMTNAFDFQTPITQSLTLHAGWKQLPAVEDCAVTFDGNGGTPQREQHVVEMNTTVSPPQKPTRDGYEFLGWFTTADASGTAFNFDTPITGNLTLYAGWKAVSQSPDILASGYCGGEGDGTNLSYVLTQDGTLTISGSGTMADYGSSSDVPWYNNRESITKAVMENGVTSIGNRAFYGCSSLTSVEIPNGVTFIGDEAFYYCSSLTSVKIPNGVTSIGNRAFRYCSSLTSVEIPGSVTSIGDFAFARSGLTSVEIPNGVTSIGYGAFSHCSGLTSVKISNSVITFVEGDVSDPFCQFCHCPSLTEVTVADGNAAFKSENGVLFSIDKTQLVYYPAGKSGTTYVVPDGVTSLISDAFCSSRLTSITIPATVVSIGKYTFFDCKDLTDIYFGGTKAQWNAIPKTRFNDDISAVTIHCADGDLLSNDSSSEDDEVLDRGQCGSNLTWTLTKDGTLTISGSGEMSEYSATSPAPWYGNRQSVKKLVVGSGVSKIGAYAFNGCTALETVSFAGTPEQWDSATKAIVEAYDDDPLEFAEVTCGGERYNLFRALNPLAKMNGFLDTKWEFPAPLNRFRNLYIDVADVDLANATPLERKATAAELPHEEGMKAYAAESGSTVLTIPDETFHTFEEGSHRITATFETKANPRDDTDTGFRSTSNVYTIFPEGPIVIDDREMVKNAVQDVSYTARLQTTPKLSDKFYKFEIVSAQLGDAPLTVTTISDYKETENEEATTVQKLGDQNFYFHPNGRFTGVPSLIGDYRLTVRLYVRRELNEDWKLEIPAPDDTSHTNPVTVEIHVEAKTAVNVKTDSPGYVVVQEPPMTLEQGTQFDVRVQIDDPNDELVAVYLDSEKLEKGRDYTVSLSLLNRGQWVQLEDAGGATQNYIQVTKTNIAQGFHSLNFEWTHKDVRGNTQTKNVARGVNVVPRTSRSSGGGGGGTTTPSTYTIKAARPANGTIALGVTRAKAGATVTFTVTPKSGYEIKGVSATDSKKRSVTLKRDGNKYSFTMPKFVVTVSASFSLSTYGVTASQAQHGKVSLNHANAAPGTIINGTTTPDKGYLLSGVTVRDAAGKSVKSETFDNGNFTFLMPSGKVTVNATFTVKRLASFVDIQGPDWFFDDAEWAYQKGILRGMTEQYWEPQSRISAVTSVVTLERLDGVDLSEYDTGADDGLDNGAWYVAAARWANVNGILPDGLPVDRDALSRGDFAVMLANFLRYRGIDTDPGDATFTDADTMSPAELDAFRILQKADVFRGYKDGTIKPRGYLSRAHLSALLRRLSDYVIKAEQERFTGA